MQIKKLVQLALMASALTLAACSSSEDAPLNTANNNTSNLEASNGNGMGAGALPDAQQLAPLCELPAIGAVIAEGAGITCGAGAGTAAPTLPELTALCAIPVLGSAIVNGAGQSCVASGGSTPSISPEQLCVIPQLGPALVSAAGGDCTNVAAPDLPIGVDQLNMLCQLPVLGPAIVDGAGSSCGGSSGGSALGGTVTNNPLAGLLGELGSLCSGLLGATPLVMVCTAADALPF